MSHFLSRTTKKQCKKKTGKTLLIEKTVSIVQQDYRSLLIVSENSLWCFDFLQVQSFEIKTFKI